MTKIAGLLRGDFKRIKLSIWVAIIAIIASIFTIVLDGMQEKWFNVCIDVICLFIWTSTLICFRYGKFVLGRLLIFISVNLILFLNASREGREAGNQFIFMPLIIASLVLFSRKEMKYILFVWGLSLICLVALELTDYSLALYPNMDPHLLYVNYLFCFILSMILIALFIANLNSVNEDSEKKLESLNKKLEKKNVNLKKANSELDSFVYKASHDLRSPLTSLMGLIELIKNEDNHETVKYYISLEEKIVYKLDNYISDILNILKNSRMPLKPEPVDVQELVDNMFHQMNYLENSKKIKKVVEVEGEILFSDRMRLNVVMNNLISNAIRYFDASKPDPTIHIRAVTDVDFCTIYVWDNGIGIGTQHLNKIYNMFYRATEHRSGSGLGLYIVKEMVERLHGNIHVKSQPGMWTEFVLTIPNLKEEALELVESSAMKE